MNSRIYADFEPGEVYLGNSYPYEQGIILVLRAAARSHVTQSFMLVTYVDGAGAIHKHILHIMSWIPLRSARLSPER